MDFAALDLAVAEPAAPESGAPENHTAEPPTVEPEAQPAVEIEAEGGSTIDSPPLCPGLEQSKPSAIAQEFAVASTIENLVSPPPPARSMLTMPGVTEPSIKAGLAPLIKRTRERVAVFPDAVSLPYGAIALGAEEDEGLESNLDARRLPLRYPLGNIRVVRGAIEAAADTTSSPWNAFPVAPSQDLAQPLGLTPAEAHPENPPAELLRWELPFAVAESLGISPAHLLVDALTEGLHWPQEPPMLPSATRTATSFLIQLADAVQAAMTLPLEAAMAPAHAASPTSATAGAASRLLVPDCAPVEPATPRPSAHPAVQFSGIVTAPIASVSLTMQQPIPLAAATPVSRYSPLDPAALRPTAHLETRLTGAIQSAMPSSASFTTPQPIPPTLATPIPGYASLEQIGLQPRIYRETPLAGAIQLAVTSSVSFTIPQPISLSVAIPVPGYAPLERAALQPPAHLEREFIEGSRDGNFDDLPGDGFCRPRAAAGVAVDASSRLCAGRARPAAAARSSGTFVYQTRRGSDDAGSSCVVRETVAGTVGACGSSARLQTVRRGCVIPARCSGDSVFAAAAGTGIRLSAPVSFKAPRHEALRHRGTSARVCARRARRTAAARSSEDLVWLGQAARDRRAGHRARLPYGGVPLASSVAGVAFVDFFRECIPNSGVRYCPDRHDAAGDGRDGFRLAARADSVRVGAADSRIGLRSDRTRSVAGSGFACTPWNRTSQPNSRFRTARTPHACASRARIHAGKA